MLPYSLHCHTKTIENPDSTFLSGRLQICLLIESSG
jgi:hypothetical protein